MIIQTLNDLKLEYDKNVCYLVAESTLSEITYSVMVCFYVKNFMILSKYNPLAQWNTSLNMGHGRQIKLPAYISPDTVTSALHDLAEDIYKYGIQPKLGEIVAFGPKIAESQLLYGDKDAR